MPKGPFVSSPEWPGTVPGLEPFHSILCTGLEMFLAVPGRECLTERALKRNDHNRPGWIPKPTRPDLPEK